jgi:hypothetical protein
MTVRFQLVVDRADPDLLARFWAAALGYALEPPPTGFASWDDTGVASASLRPTWAPARTASSIRTAAGRAPGSRWCPNLGPSRTGSTSTSRSAAGGRSRPKPKGQRVDAEARRLADLGATMVAVLGEERIDHYAVAMKDPRATNSTPTDASHSRRGVLTERPGEDAEPSPKPRNSSWSTGLDACSFSTRHDPRRRWWIRPSPPPRRTRRWEPAPVRISTRNGTPPSLVLSVGLVGSRRSGLLTLKGSSVQTDPDRSRRIVHMINRMIKQVRQLTDPVQPSTNSAAKRVRDRRQLLARRPRHRVGGGWLGEAPTLRRKLRSPRWPSARCLAVRPSGP